MNVYKVCFTIRITCKKHTKDIDAIIVVDADSDDKAVKLVKNNLKATLNIKEPIVPYIVYRDI